MVAVKFCGITCIKDAQAASDLGVAFIGLVFAEISKRRIEKTKAKEIVYSLQSIPNDRRPKVIGVFLEESEGEIIELASEVKLDAVQLPVDRLNRTIEISLPVVPVIYPSSRSLMPEKKHSIFPSLILESASRFQGGGGGDDRNLNSIHTKITHYEGVMIAGGLNLENLAQHLKKKRPWGIDVSTGIEDSTPGKKSPEKMHEFMKIVRKYEHN